jgi:uncharacterized protein (DUF1501 family)
MKRRQFLRAASATLLPVALNGMPVKVLAESKLLQWISAANSNKGRVLVLIQLNGGNDGLNTLIPLDQYSNLSKARSNVLLPESKVLKMTGTEITGLHPSMTGLRNMYDYGLVSVIQDAGYPQPDFSHFRSTDIWMSGSSSDQYLQSGWIGRMLDKQYPDFPDNYPNAEMPDPLAIQIGSGISLSLLGPHGSTGMAVSDPNQIYQMLSGTTDPTPATPAGHELTYIRLVAQQTEAYSIAVKEAAAKAQNLSPHYPANNNLAEQLKLVARLVAGGLKTPVYVVSMGGFDTHASQVDTSDTTRGFHANLLQQLSEAISAFQDDCSRLGVADRVCGMTFSEFGRRIRSNASNGTDHGTAAPQFVFGTKVNPGIIGHNPIIPDNTRNNDNLPMQYDYRQIYSTVLKDWFGLGEDTIQQDVLFSDFAELPIFKGNLSLPQQELEKLLQLECYPNPAREATHIRFTSLGTHCEVRLYDNKGRMITVIHSGKEPAGKVNVRYKTEQLRAGLYYVQLITPTGRITKTLLVE